MGGVTLVELCNASRAVHHTSRASGSWPSVAKQDRRRLSGCSFALHLPSAPYRRGAPHAFRGRRLAVGVSLAAHGSACQLKSGSKSIRSGSPTVSVARGRVGCWCGWVWMGRGGMEWGGTGRKNTSGGGRKETVCIDRHETTVHPRLTVARCLLVPVRLRSHAARSPSPGAAEHMSERAGLARHSTWKALKQASCNSFEFAKCANKYRTAWQPL